MDWFDVYTACCDAGVKIKRRQAELLGVFWTGRLYRYETVIDRLWGHDPNGGPEIAKMAIHLSVLVLRKTGFTIQTHHGIGLQLQSVPPGVTWRGKGGEY